MHILWY